MMLFRERHSGEIKSRNALGESPSEVLSDRGSTPLISTKKTGQGMAGFLYKKRPGKPGLCGAVDGT